MSGPFKLLYVEDSLADAELVKIALDECQLNVQLAIVDNGEKAMAFLNRQGVYRDAVRPELVLLDLNLPRKSGDEVLVEIKTNQDLRSIPVVVFTSAASEVICQPIYQEYANTCIRKPVDFAVFVRTVQLTCEYWFSIACLPRA